MTPGTREIWNWSPDPAVRPSPRLIGKEKRKRFNIALEPSFHARAMQEANSRGISLSQLIEIALSGVMRGEEADAERGIASAREVFDAFISKADPTVQP